MLAAQHRLRRRAEFTEATRLGVRATRGCVVAHLFLSGRPYPARVGFVVAKSVGGSVVRHRVTRRMRAAVATRVDALPEGCHLVLRALPDAATAPRLARDVLAATDAALAKAAS